MAGLVFGLAAPAFAADRIGRFVIDVKIRGETHGVDKRVHEESHTKLSQTR